MCTSYINNRQGKKERSATHNFPVLVHSHFCHFLTSQLFMVIKLETAAVYYLSMEKLSDKVSTKLGKLMER